jgi:hypothetical protein
MCSVLFMGGAGGSLRAGVTENPVKLTRSVKDSLTLRFLRRRAGLCLARRRHHLHGRRHCGCRSAFGYVPTPALVAPIEFTMRVADYARSAAMWKKSGALATCPWKRPARSPPPSQPDPMDPAHYRWAKGPK